MVSGAASDARISVASGWQGPHAGGMTTCSRWLSEARAIPPDNVPTDDRIPEGMPARPDSIQIRFVELGSRFPAESPPMAGTPAGVRGDWGLGTITRWCRFAQPPATSLQASGLPTCSGSPAEQPWRRADAHSGQMDTPNALKRWTAFFREARKRKETARGARKKK